MGSNIGNNGGGDGGNGVWCYVGDRVSVDGGCSFFLVGGSLCVDGGNNGGIEGW